MGEQLMSERCLAVAGARTEDELRLCLAQAAADLGFGLFSVTVILDHSKHVQEFLNIANPPAAYAPAFTDREGGKLDPVSQHCRRSSEILFWSQEDYLRAGSANFWEHQAGFGYRAGVAMALHLPFGRHLMFGLDGDRPLPRKPRIRAHLAKEIRMLTEHAREVAFKILAPEAQDPALGQMLNPFEVEALRWSMDDASPREIANFMDRSEADIQYFLQNAILKLGCRTKHHAILIAIRTDVLV